MPQRLDKQREGCGGLAAARVIEVVARIWRAPVLEHPPEAALVDVRLHKAFRQISQAEACEPGLEHLAGGVEEQLALDPHLEFARALFELPGVQPAMGGQAQIDAVVLDQVLRLPRFRPVAEIRGSADHRHARIGPDAHGDHVLRHLLAVPHAGIETLRDDIGQAVVADDLDLDVRIRAQKLCKLRQQDGVGRIFGGGEADGAFRLLAKLAQGREFGLDLLKPRADMTQQALTRDGRRDAACGARQEAQLETRLELLDGVAERRLRHAELGGGLGEAALARHDQEGREVIEVATLHLSILLISPCRI